MRVKLFLVLIIATACFAQSASPEPDIADIFYLVDGAKLTSLERQSVTFHGSAHGFIVTSIKSSSEFAGNKSPIRLKSGQPLEFIVRSIIPSSAIDPNTIYCLRKLNGKKKTRELVMMSGHVQPFGVSTTVKPEEGVLPVEFTAYGSSSLKVVTQQLVAGEYAIGKFDGPAVFCFGVD
jgi:hypothetical protein